MEHMFSFEWYTFKWIHASIGSASNGHKLLLNFRPIQFHFDEHIRFYRCKNYISDCNVHFFCIDHTQNGIPKPNKNVEMKDESKKRKTHETQIFVNEILNEFSFSFILLHN